MRQHEAAFANVIIKFGDEDLLDKLSEIVLPAFTDDTLVRNRRDSSFYFLDVEIVELDGRFSVAGRFVHDTILRRTQVYEDGKGLIQDEKSLRSSPSAFFVVTLDDHKLIYYGETPHAPDLGLFQRALLAFITKKYLRWIDKQNSDSIANKDRITKKKLRETYPEPTVTVVPISGEDDIEKFVARYRKIRRLDITVHKRNKEIDAADVVEDIEALRKQVGGESAKLTTTQTEGLDPQGTTEVLKDLGKSGNQTLKLSGEDLAGNKLDGSNEDFSVRTTVSIPRLETAAMARRLFAKMEELKAAGTLALQAAGPAAIRRLKEVMDRLQ